MKGERLNGSCGSELEARFSTRRLSHPRPLDRALAHLALQPARLGSIQPAVRTNQNRNHHAIPKHTAGSFLVRADAYGGILEWAVEGLATGEEQCLEREAAAFGQVMVDAENEVIESDETNNTAFVPIPTPPPICTPTPAFDYLPVIARNWAPIPTSTPSAGPLPLLRISALQYSGRDEYIEVVNEGAAQNLTGWSILSVRGNQRYAFPDEYALGPGVTVRVHSGPDAINSPPGDLFWTTDHIWNNDGDKAELYDSSERLIDSRCYNAGCP